MKAIIYHNPKCSKSRATLAILEQKGVDLTIIEYLQNPPSLNQLKALLSALNMDARGLMRIQEAAFKAQNLDDKSLSEDNLMRAMIATPSLIQRPIVKTDKGVIIARPPEDILTIL